MDNERDIRVKVKQRDIEKEIVRKKKRNVACPSVTNE